MRQNILICELKQIKNISSFRQPCADQQQVMWCLMVNVCFVFEISTACFQGCCFHAVTSRANLLSYSAVFIFLSLVQRPNVATGKSRQSEAQHSMNEWLRKNTFNRKKENRLASFLSHGCVWSWLFSKVYSHN